MPAPDVTCVIVAHNYGRYVGEAVESALGQRGFAAGELEVIVVDDGSTDDTPEVLAGFGNRIIVIRQANQGPAIAWLTGIAAARGRYVSFLDADDIWLPDFLRESVDILEARPDVGLVYGDMALVDADKNELAPSLHGTVGAKTSAPPRLGKLLISNEAPASAMTMRTDVARAVPPVPAWAWCRDWWFTAQVAANHELYAIRKACALYRLHGANVNGILNRPPERVERLMLRDLRLRRIMLRTMDLNGVPAADLTRAVRVQIEQAEAIAAAGGRSRDDALSQDADDEATAEQLAAQARATWPGEKETAVRLAVRAFAAAPSTPAVSDLEDMLDSMTGRD